MKISRRRFTAIGGSLLLKSAFPAGLRTIAATADVCVYGGTASGVMAAVAAAREGSAQP